MLNLEELERKLDLALSKETEESLNNWILSVKTKEKEYVSKDKFIVTSWSWVGLDSAKINVLEPFNSIVNIDNIKGFVGLTFEGNNIPTLYGNCLNPPPDIIKDEDFQKNMTPSFSESFFLPKLAV